ncbi:hypothetical protein HHL25_05485 [Rhizobium sp. S-51]|uniref:Uncharacterized protein n=1 Tax=Rhizobium terricola TaxID=2728849 RepID=A0A7Y0FVA1_9HYPH|nr:hypothetical protein [Rhizobium terricola]NML73576.1 hypothetical protein [Rhizobium terricola]
MRKFATIPPSIWQTDLKKLRGDIEAITIHYYLTTCSLSTMIGIYHLPVVFLAYETGLDPEGASKGLRRVCEAGIASYDEGTEIVWVHQMAATQVAPRLSPKDNRVPSVAKQLAALPICPITLDFYRTYRDAYHFADQPSLDEFERGFQGASYTLRSKEKEKDKGQEQDLGQGEGQMGSGGKRDTYTHARENEDQEFPYDPAKSVEEGKAFLRRLGLPAKFTDQALQRLMRGSLFPCDIENWKNEARELA